MAFGPRPNLRRAAGIGLACAALTLGAVTQAWPQAMAGKTPAPATPHAEVGPRWAELTPTQRTSLKPLEREWSRIDVQRKQKWLEIASRMPGMPSAERERVQDRMTEWAALSPEQRGKVRMGYQEAKLVKPEDRRAQWDAYQALTPEQKRELAAKAAPARPAAKTPRAARPDLGTEGDRTTKSNIVANPAYATRPKPVAPTVVQVQPGATTTLMSKRGAPPPHQQTGLPKIAATPEFVDKATLLPRRGPQGAAARSSAASAPATRP